MSEPNWQDFWNITEQHQQAVTERRAKLATDSLQVQDLVKQAQELEHKLMQDFKKDMEQLLKEAVQSACTFRSPEPGNTTTTPPTTQTPPVSDTIVTPGAALSAAQGSPSSFSTGVRF